MQTFFLILFALSTVVLAILWNRQRKMEEEITTQHTTDLELLEKSLQNELKKMLDALNDAFLLIGPDGKIIFANEPTVDLVAGRLIEGRNFKEVFLDSRITAAMEESLATGKAAIHQIVLPLQASPRGVAERRGETAWVIDAAPLDRNSEKTITRVIVRDITAEHQSEQVRKDFVANASHELRTPLSIINGYLENLVEDEIDDLEFLKRAHVVMKKHGDRIAHIVEDMLLISRLESGEVAALNKSSFLFSGCIQDVLERLEPMIQEQGAKTKLKLENSEMRVFGDRFYWTQVFFNLIENALKQNPKSALKLEIGSRLSSDGQLLLWVADDGVGIPNGDLPFIFRRFYRVEKHHNQDSIKGTGLGLSIVKRAVEAHQGTITVSSVPGQRTTFEITLPPSAIGEGTEEESAQCDGAGTA